MGKHNELVTNGEYGQLIWTRPPKLQPEECDAIPSISGGRWSSWFEVANKCNGQSKWNQQNKRAKEGAGQVGFPLYTVMAG